MTLQVQKQLDQIIVQIVQNNNPERIILFGSYANGKPRNESDFDLFIVSNTNQRQIDRQRTIRKTLPKSRTIGVDLIVYNPVEVEQAIKERNIFINQVLEQGKELYVKNARS